MAAVRLLQPSFFFFFNIIFFLLLLLSLTPPPMASCITEADALFKLKQSFTNADAALDSWSFNSEPCAEDNTWAGVICLKGIVTGLRLGYMGLSGKIDVDAIAEIPGIRSLGFNENDFSGPIPEFNRLGALKAIDLSSNKFSGEIPADFFSKMESLKKIWLSGNAFTGEIPASLASLQHLIELHLEDNQFSGTIPPIAQTTLTSFNASNNKLGGEIPDPLSKFNKSCFTGNDDLCGPQIGKPCVAVAAAAPKAEAAVATPTTPVPETKQGTSGNNKMAVAMGSLAGVVLLMVVVAAVVTRRRKEEEFDVLSRENFNDSVEVQVSSSNSNRKGGMVGSIRKAGSESSSTTKRGSQNGKGGNGIGDLVVVNDEKGVFGLPDLMKAAAEVLGNNGGLGSSYKAVMANGMTVVVKRMREINKLGKDGFDTEMTRFGRLRHPNILTPLAYHFRKDEKLLVYEFIPKGSLLYLLHGDRGPSHSELDWPARLKIVQGIARGMVYLHTQLGSLDLPHGNLKSSNVLVGDDYEPLLSDYGYCSILNHAQAALAMFAYKSPESVQYHLLSPKCDVYCLGIIILEILMGKFPSQYLNHGKGGTDVVQWVQTAMLEKREAELFDPEIAGSISSLGEMLRLLYIGAVCTEQSPEQRPEMKEAIRRIEEIQVKGGQEPSLIDGYADQPSHAVSVREGYGELSARGSRQESSGRRKGDSFAFAIS